MIYIFSSIRTAYYRGARAALLMFDVSDDRSLELLHHQREQLLQEVSKWDLPVLVLIGTKSDKMRSIDRKTAEDLARTWYSYFR
jgi:GTPase SAR1 family protein